uniref:Uncharacterized protein n=1 Tax=Candidatus Methanogaster sp. ANME-2c ERB4 TaxID=2759911 RepID=A0A7G9YCC3_9EURY|nr:hypothetical protein GHANLPCP_00005 [Methanosarcinales archaeon ANME-2c ERB4]QNO43278.1 hypothetical protein PDJHCPJF_00004 [Methanosarcinales archaeon ANME-2c ERB4]QNO45421.1 hypothetical protein KJMLMBBB_00001 [Methanosarcinales archaeon ANME-2c ERB4]QNO45657.1 hypothetical protein LCLBCGAP_00001 [Methanosarcinales archaeon ANME-2c ERB4]
MAKLTGEYGDEYTQKIAKGVKELQEREITGAGKVLQKLWKPRIIWLI